MSQGSYKKEWVGVRRYCNCLLVTMCQTGISKLFLETGRPVPKLESLADHFAPTREWLLSQQFHYDLLDANNVIECFATTCKIKKGLFGYPKNVNLQMKVIDVVEDDGPTVERFFEFQLDRTGRQLRLVVTLIPRS